MKIIKYTLYTFVLLLAVGISVKAQIICPVTEQNYTKQSQVDSFITRFPQCYKVSVKIRLSGPDIKNLEGFRNITIVQTRGLYIHNCDSLRSFHGLRNITILDGLFVSGNTGMDTLIAWPALEILNLSLINNTNFGSLEGLKSVPKIRILHLENTVLKNLNGINGDTLLFSLTLMANRFLENIDALSNKTQISNIVIESNHKLSNLDGLNNLNFILDLVIKDNYEIQKLPEFDKIKSVNNIIITDNKFLSKVTNIPGFRQLKTAKNIIINGLSNAQNLTGFDSLKTVETIEIQHNGITELKGFSTLHTFRSMVISYCPNLKSVNGFQSLEKFPLFSLNSISITSNEKLVDVQGFGKIKKIYFLVFSQNNSYTKELDCFQSLEEIIGILFIEDNLNLASFRFPVLKKIGIELSIGNNKKLQNLDGISSLESIGAIKINHNDVLTDLQPLGKINSERLGYVQIMNNQSCSICSVKPICEYFQSKTTLHVNDKIEGNSTGCNSVEEILNNCEITDTENETLPYLHLTNPVYETLEIQGVTAEIKTLELYSIEGTKVRASIQTEGDTQQYDVSHLRPGMYLLHFMTNNQKTGTIKWIKM